MNPTLPLAVYFEDVSPATTPERSNTPSSPAGEEPASPVVVRGVKRLRHFYGEYDSDTGEQLAYPDKEQETADPCTSATVGYPRCSKIYKKRPRLDTDSDEEGYECSLEFEEDEALDYGDKDLETFLASQESAIDGAFSKQASPEAAAPLADTTDHYTVRERPIV